MKIKKCILGIALMSMCVIFRPMSLNAANGIEIKESTVKVPYLSTAVATVEYTGSFYDLAVVVSDSSKAGAALTDLGNGKANLILSSIDFGRTVAAVYKASDLSAIDYITVDSGLTTGDQIQNIINGSKITTVYSDCVIKYDAILHGENNAQAAITGLVLTRNDGMNELNVSANIIKEDVYLTGLSTFKAEYYDASNKLIKEQKAYVRSNLGVTNNICWYIPKECVTIVLK